MIVVRVNCTINPEKRAKFLAAIEQDRLEKHAFAGCIAYRWSESVLEPNLFSLYEEWETPEAFNAFKNSEYFAQNGKVMFPLISGNPDSVTYEAQALQPA